MFVLVNLTVEQVSSRILSNISVSKTSWPLCQICQRCFLCNFKTSHSYCKFTAFTAIEVYYYYYYKKKCKTDA